MAMPGAASGGGCSESESPGRSGFVLVDLARGSSLEVDLPPEGCRARTLGELLSSYRSADLEASASAGLVEVGPLLELRRYADSLFLLEDGGALGAFDPGLRFKVGGRACDLDHRLEGERAAGRIRVEVDRSDAGYTRNWPAYLSRRWGLRADAYSGFVESVVERACGREAGSVLRLDAPDRVRRFLAAVGGRIHSSPYETYSRYLEPCTPFKSCDQALDRILEGDGGNCAEKAMALYFIAHAYGLPAEVVLGGEEAEGSFPYRTLRSTLDRRTFDFAGTQDAQRYWQHYAILCGLPGDAEEPLFCDVAGSNIPFLCLGAEEAAAYLDPGRREALRVAITLEPIRIYYHRLARRQALPLDLYYAMENFIESIDVIQTVDNELGLLHTGDYWVGAVAYRGRRELGRIVGEYGRYVRRAGLDPRVDLCFARDLTSARHPLLERFLAAYPRAAGRVVAADARLRQRIRSADQDLETCYVLIDLEKGPARSQAGAGDGRGSART